MLSPKVSNLIDKYFPVLDYGFVALKDVMGDDLAIEQAARVSYGAGTRKTSETRGLLRYLIRHRHTTPLEMVELKFHFAMPIFVARQWIRHRTANVNEYSGRYSLMPNLFYTPKQQQVSHQSKKNKQGRDDKSLTDEDYSDFVEYGKMTRGLATKQYNWCADEDISRELARIDLPLSTYTYWYWKCDLHNIFNFLRLRCDSHAQWEIRAYANVMAGIVQQVAPLAFEGFIDYIHCASNLTRLDKLVLRQELFLTKNGMLEDEAEKDLVEFAKGIGMSNTEIDEYWQKTKVADIPDFTLDMDSVKTGEHFEKIIREHTYEPKANN